LNGNADSFEQALEYMNTQQVDDAKIYSFLSQVDTARVACWLSRLDRVVAAKKPDDPSITDKKWTGRKNAIKGKIFERLVGAILCGIKGFDTWKDVTTTTNQLDMLVHLGPTAQFSPALREWGTHFICECKFEDKAIGVTWIGKLNTVLQSHLARVGVFVSRRGIANGGPGKKARNLIRTLALMTPSRFILSLDRPDLERCIAGQNLAELLSRKYVGTKIGTEFE
jgi:hypothetical protein